MTPKHDAAHPDLYTALNDAGDLRPAARVVLEHFMGALIERPLIEVAVERYLGCHGPEAHGRCCYCEPAGVGVGLLRLATVTLGDGPEVGHRDTRMRLLARLLSTACA